MRSLHELAVNLQEFIIDSLSDTRTGRTPNTVKYNNLKLKVDPTLKYPNVIIRIGISEGTYNLEDVTKTDGSLGMDERYVNKWLSHESCVEDLKNIYIGATSLIAVDDDNEETTKGEEIEGEASTAKEIKVRKRIGILPTGEEIIELDNDLVSLLEIEKKAIENQENNNI